MVGNSIHGERAFAYIRISMNASQTSADSFEGVIQALLDDPAGFSIAGFEEFYSKQEQEMLLDIRNKLMNNIGEKASTAAKPDSSELL